MYKLKNSVIFATLCGCLFVAPCVQAAGYDKTEPMVTMPLATFEGIRDMVKQTNGDDADAKKQSVLTGSKNFQYFAHIPTLRKEFLTHLDEEGKQVEAAKLGRSQLRVNLESLSGHAENTGLRSNYMLTITMDVAKLAPFAQFKRGLKRLRNASISNIGSWISTGLTSSLLAYWGYKGTFTDQGSLGCSIALMASCTALSLSYFWLSRTREQYKPIRKKMTDDGIWQESSTKDERNLNQRKMKHPFNSTYRLDTLSPATIQGLLHKKEGDEEINQAFKDKDLLPISGSSNASIYQFLTGLFSKSSCR